MRSQLFVWLIAMVALGLSFCAFFPRPNFISKASMASSSSPSPSSTSSSSSSSSSSWSTIWLHGLGDNGPNNAPLRHGFGFSDMKWNFPSAPSQPVSCNSKLIKIDTYNTKNSNTFLKLFLSFSFLPVDIG